MDLSLILSFPKTDCRHPSVSVHTAGSVDGKGRTGQIKDSRVVSGEAGNNVLFLYEIRATGIGTNRLAES